MEVLNTVVGLGLSIDLTVADPVRAVPEVKDQEISHTHADLMPCGGRLL